MDADIIVFDMESVLDSATFTKPHYPSEGMKWVLVNGVQVIENGVPSEQASPGKPIRRKVIK